MTARDDGPSLDAMREAAQRAVDASTLREVARQIGTTHYALGRFLAGGRRPPHEGTRRKIRAWYERTQAPHAMAKALTGMLETVPPEMRDDAMRELAMTVERVHRAAGVEPPGWVTELLGDEQHCA